MTTKTTTRELLHEVIDSLTAEELEDLLDYLNLQADPDSLSPEEEKLLAEADAAGESGDVVSFEESKARRRSA